MLATENLKGKNFLPKIFSEEKNISDSVTLSPLEMKYYVAEIAEMLPEGKIIDIPKAIHNAKYFAKLAASEQEIFEGKVVSFTEEEWEEFVNAQNI